MKSYILTDREYDVLAKFTVGHDLTQSDRMVLSTLKRRIKLYYTKLRLDILLVEEAKKKWQK